MGHHCKVDAKEWEFGLFLNKHFHDFVIVVTG